MPTPYEGFGSLVFNEDEMKDRLPGPVYDSWEKTVSNEGMLDRPTADAIAHAMKRWAMELGQPEAAALLDATLREESKTDEALTRLATSGANQRAKQGRSGAPA